MRKQVRMAKSAISTVLAPLSKEEQRRVLLEAQDIERQRSLRRERALLVREEKRIEGKERELEALEARIRRSCGLPDGANTPAEIETMMMATAVMQAEDDGHTAEFGRILELFERGDFIRYLGWAQKWRDSGFARMTCGVKLGAALALTDAPEDVHAPWDAWSMLVPDSLLSSVFKFGKLKVRETGETFEEAAPGVAPFRDRDATISIVRIWCFGVEPIAFIARPLLEKGDKYDLVEFDDGAPLLSLARNLVRGVCLALDQDIERYRRGEWGPKNQNREPGSKPARGAEYHLGGTVAIDLRDEVIAICSGRAGHRPTVQFLVRGHWRNQATGPRHSERKRIWIEPFWKGPEEARVLLRTHRINEPQARHD